MRVKYVECDRCHKHINENDVNSIYYILGTSELDYSQTGYDYTAEICRDCYNEIKNVLNKEIKKEVNIDGEV